MDEFLLMDNINTIITFIEKALLEDNITNYKLESINNIIKFSLKKYTEDINIIDINNIDIDTLKVIYMSIAAKYQENMQIGATSEYKDNKTKWNLAPVIDDKVLIEFSSDTTQDQEWIQEEIINSSIQKGLKH